MLEPLEKFFNNNSNFSSGIQMKNLKENEFVEFSNFSTNFETKRKSFFSRNSKEDELSLLKENSKKILNKFNEEFTKAEKELEKTNFYVKNAKEIFEKNKEILRVKEISQLPKNEQQKELLFEISQLEKLLISENFILKKIKNLIFQSFFIGFNHRSEIFTSFMVK